MRFFEIFSDFLIFWPFLTIFYFFWFFIDFWIFFPIFWVFFYFLDFFGNPCKVTKVTTKVTKATTGHQKMPKMGQNSIISSFFARRAKKASAEGRSPPQELEVSPRSKLYLLVIVVSLLRYRCYYTHQRDSLFPVCGILKHISWVSKLISIF